MIARGDFDELPLFRMYRAPRRCAARAKRTTARTASLPGDDDQLRHLVEQRLRLEPRGPQPNEVLNDYIRLAAGLELMVLMLDYYEHTLDEEFLRSSCSRWRARCCDTTRRGSRATRGKLVIQPTQAVETYWYDVVNDTPWVAGLTR